MTKQKKLLILFSILGVVITVLLSTYFIYGSTMIDITNEKSINNHLAYDKNNPITILAKDTYNDFAIVLYTDPVEEDCIFEKEFVKHKLYKNRYVSCGENTHRNTNSVSITNIRNSDFEDENVYAIYNIKTEYTSCSIFEIDNSMHILRKIDEIDVPQSAYIIFKEYQLNREDTSVIAFDGSIDMSDNKIVELNAAAE